MTTGLVEPLTEQPADPFAGLPWPEIRENGHTPIGLGLIIGWRPCFTTIRNGLTVYLRTSLAGDLTTARGVFEELLPALDGGRWPVCIIRTATVTLNGVPTEVRLCCIHSCIDIRPVNELV
jgi:hypothetical protein